MDRKLRLSRVESSLGFTAIVLSVFFGILWLFPTAPVGSRPVLPAEFLRQYDLVGSYDQRSAYLFALIAIVIFSAIGFYGMRRGLIQVTARRMTPSITIWICLVATLAGLLVYRAVIPRPISDWSFIFASAFFAFVFLAPSIERRAVEFIALLGIGGYLACVIVPGLAINPIPFPIPGSDPSSLAQLEVHLTALTQPGTGIAAGQRFFIELPYNYGLLMPSIMSVIDLRLGRLSVGDEARFVQYCQALFAIMAAMAYLLYRPRNYLGVLIALLLAAPYWSTAGIGIWHPNQTGFRSLTLPLGVLALTLAGRVRLEHAAWGLGAIGAVALLINFETTVAVGVGFLVYVLLRTRSIPLVPIGRMVVAGIAVIVAYFVLYRIALGRLPFGTDVSDILLTLREHVTGDVGHRLFTAGPHNENYYVVPLSLVMFAHAIYVVLAAFQRLGERPLSHLSALRAAIAAILIVWLAYYFNMPNWWQIWTHLFLYGFLLIELFDLRLVGIGGTRRRFDWSTFWRRPMRSRIARVVPFFLLAILIPHTNQHLVQYTREFMAPYWMRTDHQASLVSGLLIPRVFGDALKEKTAKLMELHKATRGQIKYLTYNSSFVPVMSGLFEPAPERNLWAHTPGDAAFDRIMDTILAKRRRHHPHRRADRPARGDRRAQRFSGPDAACGQPRL